MLLFRSRLFAEAAGLVLVAALVACPAGPAAAGGSVAERDQAAAPPPAVAGSGLPVPRFVSLKSDRVNLRTGPGTDYPASWVFRRAGLPVEIIKEFEAWRQVRDADGTKGWVLQSFLSGRRTALVQPWDLKREGPPPQTPLLDDNDESADTLAILEAGVIASVHSCDGRWCEVSIETMRGYIQQKKLWGVYEGEKIN